MTPDPEADVLVGYFANQLAQINTAEDIRPVVELGGAMFRRACVPCRQGAHDRCPADTSCDCRCQE